MLFSAFLRAQGRLPSEIQSELVGVYVQGVMNLKQVVYWRNEFVLQRRSNVYDLEHRLWSPSHLQENDQRGEILLLDDRQLEVRELFNPLGISKLSVHRTVSKLHLDFRIVAAR